MRKTTMPQLPHHPGEPGRRIHFRKRYLHGMAVLALLLLAAVLVGCAEEEIPGRHVIGGNPESGKLLIEFYACGSCHVIPGIADANGVVGPPLTDFGKRSMIAGAVANDPDSLIQWIVSPHSIEVGTAMPAVGATPAEARDIAAYLYTLR